MLCLSGFELYSRWEPLYSQNWECFDQSCVNRAETVHGTLRFLYLSHLLYGICVKIFIVNRIFQRATPRARILLTDNIVTIYITGAAVVSTITSLFYITYIRSILENSSSVFHRTLRNCVNYNLAKWRPRKTAKTRYKDNLPQLSYAKALELSGL